MLVRIDELLKFKIMKCSRSINFLKIMSSSVIGNSLIKDNCLLFEVKTWSDNKSGLFISEGISKL